MQKLLSTLFCGICSHSEPLPHSPVSHIVSQLSSPPLLHRKSPNFHIRFSIVTQTGCPFNSLKSVSVDANNESILGTSILLTTDETKNTQFNQILSFSPINQLYHQEPEQLLIETEKTENNFSNENILSNTSSSQQIFDQIVQKSSEVSDDSFSILSNVLTNELGSSPNLIFQNPLHSTSESSNTSSDLFPQFQFPTQPGEELESFSKTLNESNKSDNYSSFSNDLKNNYFEKGSSSSIQFNSTSPISLAEQENSQIQDTQESSLFPSHCISDDTSSLKYYKTVDLSEKMVQEAGSNDNLEDFSLNFMNSFSSKDIGTKKSFCFENLCDFFHKELFLFYLNSFKKLKGRKQISIKKMMKYYNKLKNQQINIQNINELQLEFESKTPELIKQLEQMNNCLIENQNIYHIIPLKLNGNNSLDNLILLTNQEKERIEQVFQPLLKTLERNHFTFVNLEAFHDSVLFRQYLNFILKIKSANITVKQQLDEVFNQYLSKRFSVISKQNRDKNRKHFNKNKNTLKQKLIKKYQYQLQDKHLHHIIPILMDGPNSHWNLIPVTEVEHRKIHKTFDCLFFSHSANNNHRIFNEEEFEELFPQNQ
jgi:5-methylcytosine-specific restriction endonuclease McrA